MMDIHPLPYLVYLDGACIATFVLEEHAKAFARSVPGATVNVQLGEKMMRRLR